VNNLSNAIVTEFHFTTSRSGGKGGQHVNTTESKVEMSFHIASSNYLTHEQKSLLLEKLKNKIDSEGYFHLYESGDRSQHANKETLVKKAIKLLQSSMIKPKKRRPTKLGKSAKRKRRKSKEIRSEVKKNRSKKLDI